MGGQEGLSVTWRNTVALATPDGFTLQPGIRVTGWDKFAGDILWSLRLYNTNMDHRRVCN